MASKARHGGAPRAVDVQALGAKMQKGRLHLRPKSAAAKATWGGSSDGAVLEAQVDKQAGAHRGRVYLSSAVTDVEPGGAEPARPASRAGGALREVLSEAFGVIFFHHALLVVRLSRLVDGSSEPALQVVLAQLLAGVLICGVGCGQRGHGVVVDQMHAQNVQAHGGQQAGGLEEGGD